MSQHETAVAFHALKTRPEWGIAIIRNTYRSEAFYVARVNPQNRYLKISEVFTTEAEARSAANREWLADNNACAA
ncbi:MAG: hypothetical protein A2Y38_25750 [Spirochaetes bacterium GWB1_59_5]|nr:MAG: hypothetical protein A2Y38_25750 [Spirochaetes bacterium GWB1_59_5]